MDKSRRQPEILEARMRCTYCNNQVTCKLTFKGGQQWIVCPSCDREWLITLQDPQPYIRFARTNEEQPCSYTIELMPGIEKPPSKSELDEKLRQRRIRIPDGRFEP